jgi:hypothetical protein
VGGNLVAWADFDYFVFRDTFGVELLDAIAVGAVVDGFQYVGGSGADPAQGLRTEVVVDIVRCGATEARTETSGPWPHVCQTVTTGSPPVALTADAFLRGTDVTSLVLRWPMRPHARDRFLVFHAWVRLYSSAFTTWFADTRDAATNAIWHTFGRNTQFTVGAWTLLRGILPAAANSKTAAPTLVAEGVSLLHFSATYGSGAATIDVDEVLCAQAVLAITHEGSSQANALSDPWLYEPGAQSVSFVSLPSYGQGLGNGLYAAPGAGTARVAMSGRGRDAAVPWLTFECQIRVPTAAAQVEIASVRGGRTLVHKRATLLATAGWERLATSFSTEGWDPDAETYTLLELRITGGDVFLDDLVLWVKPGTCAWACGAGERREGEACVSCEGLLATAPRPLCPVDERYVDCTLDGYTEAVACGACAAPPEHASFVARPPVECAWECDAGFWKSDSVTCSPCTTGLVCAVGEYAAVCTRTLDTRCVPCTTIADRATQNAPFAVYTTSGSAPGVNDCEYECDLAAGYYLSGDDCLPCSTPSCGNALTFQRELSCQQNRDAQCAPCAAPSPNAAIVGGSPEPDAACVEACLSGFASCASACVPPYPSDATVRLLSRAASHFASEILTPDGLRFEVGLANGVSLVATGTSKIQRITGHGAGARGLQFASGWTVTMGLRFPVPGVSEITVRVYLVQGIAGVARVWRDGVQVQQSPTPAANNLAPFVYTYTAPSAPAGTYEVEFSAVAIVVLYETEIDVRDATGCAVCAADDGACVPCDASAVPANADAVARVRPGTLTCDWVCRALYRQQGETCVFCPTATCPTGRYESDCGVCEWCTADALPAGYIGAVVFTGPGRVRFEDSCPYACTPGRYEIPGVGCEVCSEAVCVAGQYIAPCTEQSDAACRACTTACAPGSFMSAPCSLAGGDAVCSPCAGPPPPAGAEWVAGCEWECRRPGLSAAQYLLNTDTGACQTCLPECAVGSFQTACAPANGWTGCAPCALPPGAVATSAGAGTPNSCLWTCAPNATRTAAGCVVVAPPPPPPPPCRLECAPGTLANATRCACEACAPEKPAHAVWLSNFLTRTPCRWACLAPRMRRGAACVLADTLFPAPSPPPPSTTPRPGAGADPVLQGAAFAPVVVLSLLVGGAVACGRVSVVFLARLRLLPASARAARDAARAALARLRRRELA